MVCAAVLLLLRRRRAPGAFVANELVTSKYNLLNFVPVNLYHQFKRVANMYFAALVCLQVRCPVGWARRQYAEGVGCMLRARQQDTYTRMGGCFAGCAHKRAAGLVG